MSHLKQVSSDDELFKFDDYLSHPQTGPLETAELLIEDPDDDDGPIPLDSDDETRPISIWSLEYYQKYFNVDTMDIKERLMASVTPKMPGYLRPYQLKPDLYGPIWITITLIFTIAISGNIVNFLQFIADDKDVKKYHWRYEFHLVTYAALVIISYLLVVPLSLWTMCKWGTNSTSVPLISLMELICIYGYSLFIYIPIAILWMIQINFVQWSLVLFGTVLSGTVLISALIPILKPVRFYYVLIVLIGICHFLLATGFMLYFFHVPELHQTVSVINKNITMTNRTSNK